MRCGRHIPRLSAAVAGLVALAVASLCLSGCLGLSKKVTVAAQVGDTVINEEDVTAYIEGFRSQDDDRATDSGWALYLSANGYTAESFRQKVLDEVFIPEASVRIQAQAHSIVVTDEELGSVIEAEKAFYEESYGADSWTSVLASFGYDEKSWRESEMNRLLKERLADEVVGRPEPTQDQLMEYGPAIAPRFNGKHSYFVAFDTQEAGESALASLGGAGASVKLSAFRKVAELYAAASQVVPQDEEEQPQDDEPSVYSQASGMQDAGWGSLTNTPQNSNNSYTNALNILEVGTVSELAEVEEGHWVLIFCDAAYVFQENDLYDTASMPADIWSAVHDAVREQLREDTFSSWLGAAMGGEDIVVNPMPSGLPYDVNNKMQH